MIEQLTKQEDALYTKLVQEYNANDWQKVCGIDQFLKSKWENETNPTKAAMLYQIWFFACEDY